MNADKTLSMIDSLRKVTLKQKDSDIKTKYQVLTMFKDIEKLVKYQSPMPPINISEDRHKFECPRCGCVLVANEMEYRAEAEFYGYYTVVCECPCCRMNVLVEKVKGH